MSQSNCPDCGAPICPNCGKPQTAGQMGAMNTTQQHGANRPRNTMTMAPWKDLPEAGLRRRQHAPPSIGGWSSTCGAIGGSDAEPIWQRFAMQCQYRGILVPADVRERLAARWPSGPLQMLKEFDDATQGITVFVDINAQADPCLRMTHTNLVWWAAGQIGMSGDGQMGAVKPNVQSAYGGNVERARVRGPQVPPKIGIHACASGTVVAAVQQSLVNMGYSVQVSGQWDQASQDSLNASGKLFRDLAASAGYGNCTGGAPEYIPGVGAMVRVGLSFG